MYKNYKTSRLPTKTLKFLKFIIYKIKIYIVSNLEKVIPQTLLSRLTLYLITTIFIIFLGLIILIYNKHWRKIRDTLINGVANNIYYASILLDNNFTPSNFISDVVYKTFHKFNIINNPTSHYLNSYTFVNKLSKNANILSRILTNTLPYKFYIKEEPNKYIVILVLLNNNKWCEFYISKNAFFMSSLQSIIWYTFLIYLILILVSYIFFKALLRPLKKLSENVTLFGKGEDVKRLTPKGTLEIRHTIKAFNEMKERINRYIEQRTLLLSSISHDLKSALTKMSLMLELTEANENTKDLQKEISNMNHMLSNYLTFASNEFQEEPLQKLNIKNYFNEIIKPYKLINNKKIKIQYYNTIKYFSIKPVTFKRAIINLLDNSMTHANFVKITIKNSNKNYLKIIIDDNGPGINPENFKDVFKPFFRLNTARTIEKSNVGLGLSIVKDAINKNGGDITLNKSPYNGLRTNILIPY